MNTGETDVSPMTYLGHGEYCGEPHPEHEDKKESSVEGWVAFCVENRE